jgi:hypothetical protein
MVTAERDGISRTASTITRLSDQTVTLDAIEQLLINLKRKDVMSTSEMLALQVRYLQQKSAAEITKGILRSERRPCLE